MTDLKIDFGEGTGQTDLQGVLGTIDFSDWHFYPQQDDEFNQATEKLVRKVISEAMRNVLRDSPPTIDFESDGASLTVSINLGSSWNDGWIYFLANIEEMLGEFIENSHRDQMAGGDEAKTALAQCLRRCALKLETAAESTS